MVVEVLMGKEAETIGACPAYRTPFFFIPSWAQVIVSRAKNGRRSTVLVQTFKSQQSFYKMFLLRFDKATKMGAGLAD